MNLKQILKQAGVQLGYFKPEELDITCRVEKLLDKIRISKYMMLVIVRALTNEAVGDIISNRTLQLNPIVSADVLFSYIELVRLEVIEVRTDYIIVNPIAYDILNYLFKENERQAR